MADILKVFGGFVSAKGSVAEGAAIREANYKQAAQLRYNAGQTEAMGQRQGSEELRKAALLQSRILAVAGASGAGAVDPTVLDLAAGVSAEGTLNAATRRYNAAAEAKGMREQAEATQTSGDTAYTAGRWRAASTILQTTASAADSYGKPGK